MVFVIIKYKNVQKCHKLYLKENSFYKFSYLIHYHYWVYYTGI